MPIGNVTPIPTTAELEELSVEEEILDSSKRHMTNFQTIFNTPLKSLLKKASFNNNEEADR